MSSCRSRGRSVVITTEFPLGYLKSTWGQLVRESTGRPFRAEPRPGSVGGGDSLLCLAHPFHEGVLLRSRLCLQVGTGHASSEIGSSVTILQSTVITKFPTYPGWLLSPSPPGASLRWAREHKVSLGAPEGPWGPQKEVESEGFCPTAQPRAGPHPVWEGTETNAWT